MRWSLKLIFAYAHVGVLKKNNLPWLTLGFLWKEFKLFVRLFKKPNNIISDWCFIWSNSAFCSCSFLSFSSLLLLVRMSEDCDAAGQAILRPIGAQHGIVRGQRHKDEIVVWVGRDWMRSPGRVHRVSRRCRCHGRHVIGREPLHQPLVLCIHHAGWGRPVAC